tara:strand:+ start:3071 stop:3889 length:819 start_codon:yes stop_codon:yes gene_type:complete
MKRLLLIGPGDSLETLNSNLLKSTPSLYFGSSFHWFDKNDVCPTYYTFIDPNTITYFDALINGISDYDKTHPNRYDYKSYISYLKNTPPYSKNFLSNISKSTTLMYGDLQGSEDFYKKGFTTSRGLRWFMGEYKNGVLSRVESHFKEVKKLPQNICVNDYSSLYNPSLKHLSPIIIHEPNINTDKFTCYILPLVLSYFKELKEIECIGFGDFNTPRLSNNTSEGYNQYKASYERMKNELINLLNFKNISISFKNKDSYFIELENNTNKNNIN